MQHGALKYAFEDGPGTVGLRIATLADGGVCVELWDDGKGLPPGRVTGGGTGMRLIANLARQLHSRLEWGAGGGGGTRLQMNFQLRRPH